MDPNEYQKLTATTELYTAASEEFLLEAMNSFPHNHSINTLSMMYCAGKLNGEAGEVAEIVFKAFRGDGGHLADNERYKLQQELGDVLWYVARLADLIEVPLEEIMERNIQKLTDRKERGIIHGYGSER